MSLVKRLRASLCDTFDEVGALAPTNCEGWLAQDLAAHLWLRERRPDALPGIGWPRFSAYTSRVQVEALHRHGFSRLVSDLRRAASPTGMGPLALAEFLIHGIDVARPNGIEHELSAGDEARIWPYTDMFCRRIVSRFGGRAVIHPTTGRPLALGRGDRPVLISGAPSEILYFVSGRLDHAHVELVAEPESLARFRGAVKPL